MIRMRLPLSVIAALVALLAFAELASAGAPCPQGFRCLEVSVPLDRSGSVPGTLDLPVAVQKGDDPVLLALGGGPGQAMVRVAKPLGEIFDVVAPGHRVAVVDQRGTGATALHCRAMQRAALTDLSVPPPGSVEECGETLGASRAFYTTTDTVADLDVVRQALGVDQVAIYGVSYGTYVAERYARAFPENVSRVVLDSVLPQEDVDPFFVDNMHRAGLILEQLCTRGSLCAQATDDPVRDLRRLVRRTSKTPLRGSAGAGKPPSAPVRIDGPALFDLIVTLTSFDQATFTVFPRAVKKALRGSSGPLLRMARKAREQNFIPDAANVSWGLHTATVCADVSFPWGSPASDPASREAAVANAVAALRAGALDPFDRSTAAGNGLLDTCERWPATTVEPPPAPGPLPAVPILVLNGSWDLSTPVEGARLEARRSPTAQLAVLPQVGHSALTSAGCAQVTVLRFFADEPLGKPCKGHRAPRRP